MKNQLRRAREVRIGDRVVAPDGPLTVTSTRIEGVGGGMVSLGFAERRERSGFRPGDMIEVLAPGPPWELAG
jgi:hypothetical protein